MKVLQIVYRHEYTEQMEVVRAYYDKHQTIEKRHLELIPDDVFVHIERISDFDCGIFFYKVVDESASPVAEEENLEDGMLYTERMLMGPDEEKPFH